MSLCGVLFVVFLVLKLIGLISWSWIWVFSPIWIPWLCLGFLKLRDTFDDWSNDKYNW